MFSWSLATDSRPLGTRITLTDTKRRWQKHCFKRCLAGLLVSNTSKWIKLSPIKYLTTLFPLWVFLRLCHRVPGRQKTFLRDAVCKYYTNITGREMCNLACSFDQRMGCIVLGMKSRMYHFCVLPCSLTWFKLNLLLELKYSPASTFTLANWRANQLQEPLKKQQLCSSMLSSKPTVAKWNIYFMWLNAFNDRISLVLYFEFRIKHYLKQMCLRPSALF